LKAVAAGSKFEMVLSSSRSVSILLVMPAFGSSPSSARASSRVAPGCSAASRSASAASETRPLAPPAPAPFAFSILKAAVTSSSRMSTPPRAFFGTLLTTRGGSAIVARGLARRRLFRPLSLLY
jgi:hypothetical protein